VDLITRTGFLLKVLERIQFWANNKVWCNWEQLGEHTGYTMGTPNFPLKIKKKKKSSLLLPSPPFSLLGACLSSLIGLLF